MTERTPPQVWRNMHRCTGPCYALTAIVRGPVAPHTDTADDGDRSYGLILRSDGHTLFSDAAPNGIELRAGDLYAIDAHDRHWTECADSKSELHFLFAIVPPGAAWPDPQTIAADLRKTFNLARRQQERFQ